MPERIPAVGERVGFVDDAYRERTGTVASGTSSFFGQIMLNVKPDGDWPADELGNDGTIPLTLEECFELDEDDDLDESFEAPC
jgi:hypothetical protein